MKIPNAWSRKSVMTMFLKVSISCLKKNKESWKKPQQTCLLLRQLSKDSNKLQTCIIKAITIFSLSNMDVKKIYIVVKKKLWRKRRDLRLNEDLKRRSNENWNYQDDLSNWLKTVVRKLLMELSYRCVEVLFHRQYSRVL